MNSFSNKFLFMCLLVIDCTCAVANEIKVSHPGAGITVLSFEQVPDVLGIPYDDDEPLQINSEAPVQVLRYSDYPEFFLDGEQPLQSNQVFVVVKSNCGDDATLIPQIDFVNSTRTGVDWDSSSYTTSIDITFPSATDDSFDTETFLEASIFHAKWGYTSFWCEETQQTVEPTDTTPKRTAVPSQSTPEQTAAPSQAQAQTSVTKPPVTTIEDPSGTSSGVEFTSATPPVGTPSPVNNGGGDSAAASNKAVMMSVIVAVASSLLVMIGSHGGGGHISTKVWGGTALLIIMAAVSVTTSTMTHAERPVKIQSASAGTTAASRKLQECSVTVEILIDGCRRAQSGLDRPDLMIMAPAVQLMDGEVRGIISSENATNKCFTDYETSLVFTPTPSNDVVAIERQSQPVFSVKSFGSEAPQYGSCFRPVEGRPYVDAQGRHVHAGTVHETAAAWSVPAHEGKLIVDQDKMLGKQWLNRAIGEHASVPAFAAFTIALMSNNAPPELVQDALSAAQDEVRHAKTSFEVASLLLGETVEPGPLPPSSLSFGHDLTALALAAAKEGCVDETLSALVAGLEVDYQIDEQTHLSEETRAALKDIIRIIALEETKHSGLAWRTVRWACSMDKDACEAVETQVLHKDYFDLAFIKRFGHLEAPMAQAAKQVWEKLHMTLAPIVLYGNQPLSDAPFDMRCLVEKNDLDEQRNSVVELMGLRIISQLTCSM